MKHIASIASIPVAAFVALAFLAGCGHYIARELSSCVELPEINYLFCRCTDGTQILKFRAEFFQ